jgi:uncharacterized membrane-anchored protein YitT (DUF2179 family)
MPRNRSAARLAAPLHQAAEYVMVLAGCLIIALSFNLFLNPNQIASGGVAGISTIVHYLWNVEPAVTQWILNIPLFILGALFLGGQFGLKTAVSSVAMPFFVLLTSMIHPPTTNPLLASIYGGLGIGAGLGVVFRAKGSTGGLDAAAQLIHKWTGIGYGLAVAILDGMVILAAGFVFSPEKALYALIVLYVTAKTIDLVQLGFRRSKMAFIISSETEAIRQAVLQQLDRGLTLLDGRGGYTGENRPILMVVVGRTEVARLKAIVREADRDAFVILADAAEVLGEGFDLPR